VKRLSRCSRRNNRGSARLGGAVGRAIGSARPERVVRLLGGLLGALSRAAVQRGGKEISDDRRGGTDERLARAIQPVGPGSVGIRALSWSAVAGKADTLCQEIIRRTRWRVPRRPAVSTGCLGCRECSLDRGGVGSFRASQRGSGARTRQWVFPHTLWASRRRSRRAAPHSLWRLRLQYGSCSMVTVKTFRFEGRGRSARARSRDRARVQREGNGVVAACTSLWRPVSPSRRRRLR
jgi:hypothetical protein